ncbi:3-oxoacyl-reductase [Aspergillus steynii IBT 23096]|uniref:3-oxoacyl-reductase n=1 Tax=Aspergillus steynii IBT 23096 TaxID=1392250 RepID=A0A2I2GLS8_9EURO|nr:3-oxoacyl-reductase [Aspergillus steynii IBT 23096]PLB53827.1 3-oxoacyl-reductase [Aspergillus steynii IBT 23096]
MPQGRIWFITGASSGLGLQLALTASQHGDTVIATSRDPSKLAPLAEQNPLIIPKPLDPATASPDTLTTLIDEITTAHGPIDILVNNAGYILEGAIEECTDAELEAQFAVNVFSPVRVIRAVAPSMRARSAGIIANIGSIGGWNGSPSAGFYCASKAAVGVYTEALKAELAPFGVDVTCIEPGYFRTGFLTSGHKVSAGKRIPELDVATRGMREALEAYSLKQPGDPVKGAQVMYEALTKTGRFEVLREEGRHLPARLALGKDALDAIGGSLQREREMLDTWGGVVGETDCADVQ